MKIYDDIGCAAPEILLPREDIDMEKWSVIACDQYTSEAKFWETAKELVGDAPSSLKLILPEYYLPRETEEEQEKRLSDIAKTAEEYLEKGIFRTLPEGFILTDRATSLHPSRKGLVLAVDLEKYSFRPEDKALIRATEGTVLERIPPRVKIRSNSPLELPHIMLLIDDIMGTVIERAWDKAIDQGLKPVYDTDLMQDCGHIKGVFIPDGSDIADGIRSSLRELLSKSKDGLLFLVGDGNHSLASAKAYWEEVRKGLSEEERKDHPARFALAEVVNIHDFGLDFEPIHRIALDIKQKDFIENAVKCNLKISGLPRDDGKDDPEFNTKQHFFVIGDDPSDDEMFFWSDPPAPLAVGTCDLLCEKMGLKIDYIHGEDSVRSLADVNTGIILPAIKKSTFFETVERDGVFPRKTFSMGEAFEKRFYLEARIIRK